jgi:hypothetical protein
VFISIVKAEVGEFCAFCGEPLPCDDCKPINLGFIGYYVYDGKVMSTSFYWQTLEVGAMIDWDAVDEAYANWTGLKPDRTSWQTSGYASFTFEDYAEIGHGDFNAGQLEAYYLSFYVDPGYVLPISFNVRFNAEMAGSGGGPNGGWYNDFNFQKLEADVKCVDWDAVYEAYENAGLAYKWDEYVILGWGSSGPDAQYFEGVRPDICIESLVAGMIEGVTKDFTFQPVLVKKVCGNVYGGELWECGNCENCNPAPPVVPTDATATYNSNLQGGNNNRLFFTVTVTYSDGSTKVVNHEENVSGGNRGNKTFNFDEYSVYAVWNSSNTVTSLTVTLKK